MSTAPAWRLQDNPSPTDPGPQAGALDANAFHGRNAGLPDTGAAAKNPRVSDSRTGCVGKGLSHFSIVPTPSCLNPVSTSRRNLTLPVVERRSAGMQRPPAHIALRPKSTSVTGASSEGFQSHSFLDATHCLILVTTIPASVAVTNISTQWKSPAVSSAPLGSGGANERQVLRPAAFLRQANPRNRSVTRVRTGLVHSPADAHRSIVSR